MIEAMLSALSMLANPMSILMLMIGTLLGSFFGALPGLGGIIAMAVALPFTYGMDSTLAMFLFAGIITSETFGGSIPAILLNTPGTPQNAASCFDGYPMAARGEAGRAIAISATACFFGSLGGVVITLLLLPIVKTMVYAFAPPEFFWLTVFGLVTIAVASRGNMIKGLVGGGVGILIAMIGYEQMRGTFRYTFGSDYLWDGIPMVPFVVGIFAVSELIVYSARGGSTVRTARDTRSINWRRQAIDGVVDVVRRPLQSGRSAAIGAGIGIIPGMGGPVAAFVSYMVAMRRSKHPEQFGKGSVEGLLASETANDAKDGGSLLPTIAFGIPGSADMAILLGVFVLHGLQPGPLLLRDHMDLVYVLLFGIVIAQVALSGFGLLSAPLLARISILPSRLLTPFVLTLVFLGTYMVRSNIFDVAVALLAGVMGYLMRRFGFPMITLAMGFILGPIVELNFLQTLQISQGDYLIFVNRPISLIFIVIIVTMLLAPVIKNTFSSRLTDKKRKKEA